MVIRHDYLEKVRPYVDLDIVKVLTGIRRSGKSVLMEQIRDLLVKPKTPDGEFIYFNLEEEENAAYLKKGALHAHVLERMSQCGARKVYVFLDEIHHVEDWEITVNSLRAKKNVDVYITGSNSKLLSGELASHLTGRYVEILVTPSSFPEFEEAARASFPQLTQDALFAQYLQFGGMPFLSSLGYRADLCRNYLEDVYSSILLKDVVRRGRIRDVDMLGRIFQFVMTEAGHTFSAASIVRFLKSERRPCTVDTVLNYLELGEEAFLFHRVKREDLVGRRILAVDEKFYVTDTGMRRALVGGVAMRDIDQMLENLVYLELVRRGFRVTVGRVHEQEVDFVVDRNGDKSYYQVAYLMPTEETRTREFGAFRGIPDSYPRFVISMDPVDMSMDGIRHVRALDFFSDRAGHSTLGRISGK